jgi:hypothetical protein
LYFETHLYLHSNNDMYMWNQVNCTQNYYANVGMSAPYNKWSYLLVSCPHHRVWVEIVDANPIIVAQLSKEGMTQIPKSTPLIILKNNYFTRMGFWIALTI